jgi:hypothetical protein
MRAAKPSCAVDRPLTGAAVFEGVSDIIDEPANACRPIELVDEGDRQPVTPAT